MLTFFKKTLLTCSLAAVGVLFINSTPANKNPKLENWLITVRYALEGLPQEEADLIERLVQQKIQRGVNLDDNTLVTQLIHGTLIEHVKQQTWNDLQQLPQKERLTQQQLDQIINDVTNNFAYLLEHMPTIEGKYMQPFFGKSRAFSIEARVNDTIYKQELRTHNSTFQHNAVPVCYYPATPGLQMPPVIPNTNYANDREYCAQQHAQAIAHELKGVLSDAHIQRLQVLVADSTRYFRHIPADNRNSLVKTGFAQLLDEQLNAYQQKLSPWVINQQKLTDSITTTREKGLATINSLDRIDRQKIRALFGDCGDRNCIEEEIIINMDIQCPICYEEFMQEHRNGKADRVILKSADKRRSCGHAVCKDCIKNPKHIRCPKCRAEIDKKDLNAKLKK